MATAPPEDVALLDRLRARDPDALRALYDAHAGRVLGAARVVLGDHARAEEIVQTVFLAVWEHPERVDPARGSLRTYLVTLARSRALDVIRADGARQRREASDHRRTEPLHDGTTDLAGSDLDVRAALAALPADERAALVAAYVGGLSYREAAVHLGVPEGTLKSRIRAGLARLRTALDDPVGDRP